MENVKIRRATPEDKTAVLRINRDVYEGRDYLPAYYDHFLSSSTMFPAVALHRDTIVAYVVGHIIDGGQTIVTRAGRTDPNFAAKGINIMLTQYLFDWGHSLGAITKVYTTSDTNPALNRPSYKSQTKHILTKQFPMYYFAGQGLSFSEKNQLYASKLKAITDLHLSLYFKSKVICDYIGPEGRLIVDLVPYKLTDVNIPLMTEPKEYSVIYSDIHEDRGHCSGLLSVGMVHPVPRPQYKYSLEIFGKDVASLRLHIIKHLMRVKEKTTGMTAMLVYVPVTFDLEKVDAVFEEFRILRRPLRSIYPGLKSRQLYAYELIVEKINSNL